ncbi:MAG: hypothetical protein ACHP85_20295, partial [Burkholderiales bacterium]
MVGAGFGALGELAPVVRAARRQPRFWLCAVATDGLGVGATTAVFAVVQAVRLRELPFRDPARHLWLTNPRTARHRAPLSLPALEPYRRDNRTLLGLA